MITLVWNDVAATQLEAAAQEVQRLVDGTADKEEVQTWARAGIAAAAAVDPMDCNLPPFESLANALASAGEEQLLKDAADALPKHPQALYALAAAARGKKWDDLANSIMVRCLVQTGIAAWPGELAYQQEWRQQYEEQLVDTLQKVWKKRASRNVAKQAMTLAAEAEDVDAKQAEENLKALLTPADLWTTPNRRGRPARGKQAASGRSRGGRRPAANSRPQRSSSRSRTPRKSEGDSE
jgi:hypothetical protein